MLSWRHSVPWNIGTKCSPLFLWWQIWVLVRISFYQNSTHQLNKDYAYSRITHCLPLILPTSKYDPRWADQHHPGTYLKSRFSDYIQTFWIRDSGWGPVTWVLTRPLVNLRNVQTHNNFYEFIWAKLTTIAGKQNLNGLRKCSIKWQFCYLFYTSESKGKTQGGYVKSAGDRLGRQEKAKARNLWDWIKSQEEQTHTSFPLVGVG